MERKVGLRSGQRPQGYHSSSEGLKALEDAKRDALRARKERGSSFAARLQKGSDADVDGADIDGDGQESDGAEGRERMTFHPGGPRAGGTGTGGQWRIKG